MTTFFLVKETLHDNLKVLGFESFLSHHKHAKDFNFDSEMFNKPNQRAFELVTLFITKCLKNEQLLASYRGCYPCLDKNQEAQFRKIAFQYLKSLEKEDSGLRILPIYTVQPGGEVFCNYLLALTNYVMIKCLNQKLSNSELDENEDDLNKKCKYHLDQYKSICQSLEKVEAKWKEDIEYFDLRQKSLLQQLDETKLPLQELTQKLKELGFDSNQDLNYIRKVTINMSNEVSNEWQEIMSLCEKVTSMIYFCNSILEKNEENQSLNLIHLAELSNSKYLNNGQLDIEQLYFDLKPILSSFWSDISSLKSKIPEFKTITQNLNFITTELDKQLEEMKTLESQLEEKCKSMKLMSIEKRAFLLNSKEIQERREWFSNQIPLIFPVFDFKLKSNKLAEDDLIQNKTPSTPSEFSSRRISKLSHEFDYSFHPFDMTLTYIPPSAPDRILLSPLRIINSVTKEPFNQFDQTENA